MGLKLNDLWDFVYGKLIDNLSGSQGMGLGTHWWLGSGYSLSEDMEQQVTRLKDLCAEATTNPSWVSHDITGDNIPETFCNRASAFIAQGMGYFDFGPNENADQMIGRMCSDPAWKVIPWKEGPSLVAKGALVFYCVTENPHGHLVAGYPASPEESSTWGEPVPMVAHVGIPPNGIVRLSKAFSFAKEPLLQCFVLESSLL